jgi:hypothetical protein
MAIAVIGGLLVSTFLSLLFVPAFFTVIDDLRLALQRGWRELTAASRKRAEMANAGRMGREVGSVNGPAE